MRFVVVVLAVIGLVAVFNSVFGSAAASVGLLLLIPILLFKLFIIMMLLGFIGRKFWGWGDHPHRWRHQGGRRRRPDIPSSEDRFENWHRMAHAKEEVDSWDPEVPGTEAE